MEYTKIWGMVTKMFGMSEDEKKEKEARSKKVKEHQKKCNFLTKSGRCCLADPNVTGYATNTNYSCKFEDCIFMKILEKLK